MELARRHQRPPWVPLSHMTARKSCCHRFRCWAAQPRPGAWRRVVFDLINVINGVAKLPQSAHSRQASGVLHLLPASQTRDKNALTEDGVAKVIEELRTKFDWIICDSPAGIERGATLAMR